MPGDQHNAHELYKCGKLHEALAAQTSAVQRRPQNVDSRGFLIDLLVLSGELERADLQLDAHAKLDPKGATSVALLRQLIRAESWRKQFFTIGRLPEFVEKPTEEVELRLKASIATREGKLEEAGQLLNRAEESRKRTRGTENGVPFEDMRDLDDQMGGVVEVLTSTGKYYWIPLSRIAEIEFRKPERPRDLVWLRAGMSVREGPSGEVYLPTLYSRLQPESDEQMLLGRATDWIGGGAIPVRGRGLRTFLVGDEARTIMDMVNLRMEARDEEV